MSLRRNAVRAGAGVALAAFAAAAAPAAAPRGRGPARCTPTLGYNANIPTWEQWFAAIPTPDAVLPFGAGAATPGGGAPANGAAAPRPPGAT